MVTECLFLLAARPLWPELRAGQRRGVQALVALLCFRLRPFTSYKLSLKATNDIGDSDFSAEMDEVTMLQDGEPAGTQAGVQTRASSIAAAFGPADMGSHREAPLHPKPGRGHPGERGQWLLSSGVP